MQEPTNLIALKREKERAVALLGQRFAEDLIDEDELESRLERTEQATRLEELHALTVDLLDPAEAAAPGSALVATESASPLVSSPAPSVAIARREDVRDHDRRVAIFGESKQTGPWIPPRILTSVTVFGDTDLDFREATLAPGVTEIELQAALGDVDIIVPPGLYVEVNCSCILASVENDGGGGVPPTNPNTPSLRLTGFAVLADVKVEVRLPGETHREAKKRKKVERKALKKAQKRNRALRS